eukprot:gene752-816_t
MASILSMTFEKIISYSPLRINPFLAIFLTAVLAYLPHFLRRPILSKKLKEMNRTFNIAYSRQLTQMALDDSPLGRSLAIYVGCNQNGMEALIYFPACLLSALSVRVDKEIIESAAGLFLTLRVIYTAIYLSSLNGPLRTVVWFTALFVCLGLLTSAYDRYDEHSY